MKGEIGKSNIEGCYQLYLEGASNNIEKCCKMPTLVLFKTPLDNLTVAPRTRMMGRRRQNFLQLSCHLVNFE